jgi:hypothetical protein
MRHFRDWRRNVSLDEERTEGKRNYRMVKKKKRNVSKCLILDVLFRTKDVFKQAVVERLAWKVWGIRFPI